MESGVLSSCEKIQGCSRYHVSISQDYSSLMILDCSRIYVRCPENPFSLFCSKLPKIVWPCDVFTRTFRHLASFGFMPSSVDIR